MPEGRDPKMTFAKPPFDMTQLIELLSLKAPKVESADLSGGERREDPVINFLATPTFIKRPTPPSLILTNHANFNCFKQG